MNTRSLMKQAKQYYPNSKNLRKQWVLKTIWLISEGKHILHDGVAKWGHGTQLTGEQNESV